MKGKGIDIFCASHAATAIRLSTTNLMDELAPFSSSSTSSSSTAYLGGYGGGRAIDRYNPIIRNERRILKPLLSPPSSSSSSNNNPPQPPTTTTKPHKHHHKNIPSSKESEKTKSSKKIASSSKQRKSNADFAEGNNGNSSIVRKGSGGGWGCKMAGDFISPPSSTRYLLSDTSSTALFNVLSDFDPLLTLKAPVEKPHPVEKHESSAPPMPSRRPSPPPPPSRSPDQVVVLRVSLHCRGCERKMRKHLSRMEGVTSFNIDFAAKKVTVVGDVTPLSVLASVSKVKNAQLLTPPVSSSPVPPPTSMDSDFKEIKKHLGIVV